MYQEEVPPGVDWWAAAYHKAGHAVVALALGLEVELVALVEDGLPGICHIRKQDVPATALAPGEPCPAEVAKRVRAYAIYQSAGPIGEKATGRSYPDGWDDENSAIQRAYACVKSSGSTAITLEELWIEMQERALEILSVNKTALTAIAKEIHEQGRIEGPRLKEIAAKVGLQKVDW